MPSHSFPTLGFGEHDLEEVSPRGGISRWPLESLGMPFSGMSSLLCGDGACCAGLRAVLATAPRRRPAGRGMPGEIDRPLVIVSKRLVHGRIGTLDSQRPDVTGGAARRPTSRMPSWQSEGFCGKSRR